KIAILIGNNQFPVVKPNQPLMRAFGLHTVVRCRGGGAWRSYPMPGVAPRFFVASRYRLATGPGRWSAVAADWDPLREVIVAEPGPPGNDAPARITVVEDTPDRQVLDVGSGGGILVASELFYPGWNVRVDG